MLRFDGRVAVVTGAGADTSHQTMIKTTEDYFYQECFCVFLKLSDYEKHMKDNHKEKPIFQCGLCVQKFHSGEKSFGCDHCDKRFIQKSSLTKQMRIHSGKKPFGCDDCGNFFS